MREAGGGDKRRGAGTIDWYKLHMLEIPDLSDVDVTHIIRNAWPVNFSRGLESFEGHVRGPVKLVKIARRSSAKDVRVLFATSIAVVGQYLSQPVPEKPVPPESTVAFGYPEAKWVCKLLLSLEGKIRGSSVRIGQMTGAEGVGVWNESKHFPVVVSASKAVGALPRLEGTLSCLSVNHASQIIVELLFSERFKPIYHMENPARQGWTAVIDNLADILEIPILDYAEWLERVRGNEQVNKLVGFLERHFEQWWRSAGDGGGEEGFEGNEIVWYSWKKGIWKSSMLIIGGAWASFNGTSVHVIVYL